MELWESRTVGARDRSRMFMAIDARLCWVTWCQVLRIVGSWAVDTRGCGYQGAVDTKE